LAQAAQQQATWRSEGHEIAIAVNVSPAEASAEGFPSLLKRTLAEADISGAALELEITEGLLMDPEKPSVQAFLATCAEEGIGLAIDDFGIGYSSLNYLMKLPISKVKIDRSFVAGLNDQRNATLVEGIVSLGHRLEKRIVAEGVQTENQLERLRAIGWR
jgi:EAL domain-containing protein (putative c-di-GMP-specific phosphodiesterase class I)